VWIVHGPKGTITLFGSVHLLPAGLDWRPAALDAALASADEIWFELPINAATNNEVAQLAIARGALPKGKHLSDLLSAAQAARLAQAAAALSCPPQALDVMQPWMAELTLGVTEDVRGGASGSDGVEQTLQASAPPTAQRHAFETAAEQIEFLAGSTTIPAPIGGWSTSGWRPTSPACNATPSTRWSRSRRGSTTAWSASATATGCRP
jgi:hypothetical protein